MAKANFTESGNPLLRSGTRYDEYAAIQPSPAPASSVRCTGCDRTPPPQTNTVPHNSHQFNLNGGKAPPRYLYPEDEEALDILVHGRHFIPTTAAARIEVAEVYNRFLRKDDNIFGPADTKCEYFAGMLKTLRVLRTEEGSIFDFDVPEPRMNMFVEQIISSCVEIVQEEGKLSFADRPFLACKAVLPCGVADFTIECENRKNVVVTVAKNLSNGKARALLLMDTALAINEEQGTPSDAIYGIITDYYRWIFVKRTPQKIVWSRDFIFSSSREEDAIRVARRVCSLLRDSSHPQKRAAKDSFVAPDAIERLRPKQIQAHTMLGNSIWWDHRRVLNDLVVENGGKAPSRYLYPEDEEALDILRFLRKDDGNFGPADMKRECFADMFTCLEVTEKTMRTVFKFDVPESRIRRSVKDVVSSCAILLYEEFKKAGKLDGNVRLATEPFLESRAILPCGVADLTIEYEKSWSP